MKTANLRRYDGAWRRKIGFWGAGLALCGLLVGLTGCPDPSSDLGKAIRDAASPSLESGVRSIADGLISALFTAIDTQTTSG